MPKVQRRPAIDASIRLVKLLGLLPRAPAKASTRQLRESLASAGIDVDLRSIQRDLIRLSAHFPITSDGAKPEAGWQWVRGAAELTAPGLDDRAALAWVLAGQYLDALLPEDIKDSLRPRFEAAKKVLAQTPFARTRRWAERVVARPKGFQLLPPKLEPNVAEIVQRGLLDRRRLQLHYHHPAHDELQEYLVSVLGLVVRGQLTYLVTVLWEYDDVLLLRLDRIKRAALTELLAREPKGFSFAAYLSSGELEWPTGPVIKLKLDIASDLIRILEETPVSGDQRIVPIRPGWARLTATVQETMELRTWIASLAPRARRVR